MSLTLEILDALQHSFIGESVAKTNHLVGATFQIFHVLGFIFLLSSVILVNLRLLGIGLVAETAKEIARDTNRLIWIGFASAVISGIAMFLSAVPLYYYNRAFQWKIVILVVAALVQLTLFRKVTATDTPNPALARISVVASTALWFGVAIAGRAIGYI